VLNHHEPRNHCQVLHLSDVTSARGPVALALRARLAAVLRLLGRHSRAARSLPLRARPAALGNRTASWQSNLSGSFNESRARSVGPEQVGANEAPPLTKPADAHSVRPRRGYGISTFTISTYSTFPPWAHRAATCASVISPASESAAFAPSIGTVRPAHEVGSRTPVRLDSLARLRSFPAIGYGVRQCGSHPSPSLPFRSSSQTCRDCRCRHSCAPSKANHPEVASLPPVERFVNSPLIGRQLHSGQRQFKHGATLEGIAAVPAVRPRGCARPRTPQYGAMLRLSPRTSLPVRTASFRSLH
jgi:hypothetical protein